MSEGVIYVLTWKRTGHFYIGQTTDVKRRKKDHLSLMKDQKHKNKKVQAVYNLYGSPQFKILITAAKDDLDKEEQKFLDIFYTNSLCLNINPVADVKSRRKTWTEAQKEAVRGRKKSPETIAKVILAKTGVPLTKAHKEKLRKAAAKRAVLQYTLEGVLVKEHSSLHDAAKSIGLKASTIHYCLQVDTRTSGGYRWKYKNVVQKAKPSVVQSTQTAENTDNTQNKEETEQ